MRPNGAIKYCHARANVLYIYIAAHMHCFQSTISSHGTDYYLRCLRLRLDNCVYVCVVGCEVQVRAREIALGKRMLEC